jgi:hypothetical protein
MITRDQKTVDSTSPGKEKETTTGHAGAGHDDTCRCKEVSKMTPQELLKLMISDLAFWKKAKKK